MNAMLVFGKQCWGRLLREISGCLDGYSCILDFVPCCICILELGYLHLDLGGIRINGGFSQKGLILALEGMGRPIRYLVLTFPLSGREDNTIEITNSRQVHNLEILSFLFPICVLYSIFMGAGEKTKSWIQLDIEGDERCT
jgi:hypothetical protein